MATSYSIEYELFDGGRFRDGYTAPDSYTPGELVILPTADDVERDIEPADFGGWYGNPQLEGDVITEIPISASSDYDLYAKWVRYTPDAEGQQGEIDILTSGVYPYEYEGHTPIRVMFGVKQTKGTVGRPIGTIEVRDANTGEFLYDYTNMQQMNVDNATIKRLVLGKYVISPHTSLSPLDHIDDDSLLIEYMGD